MNEENGKAVADELDRVIIEKINTGIAMRIVEVMNEATEADPEAIRRLVEHREQCTPKLANHPTIHVVAIGAPPLEPCEYEVGLLGILNGIAGAHPDKHGRIEASFNVECTECFFEDDDERMKDRVVGDLCPLCGKKLVLGSLIGFKLSDPEKHQGDRE